MKFAMFVDDVKPIKSMKHKIKILLPPLEPSSLKKSLKYGEFYSHTLNNYFKKKINVFPHFYNV